MRKWLALAFACLPASTIAQPSPPVAEWTEIETVEANARPGPAVWHVTRGEAEVWILATVGPMPKNLDWNRQYASELIDGAKVVLRPPGAGIGLGDAAWLLIAYGNRLSLPRGQALEAIMPADIRARFVALRTSLGRDESRYRTDSPVRAAIRLAGDFTDKRNLRGGDGIGKIVGDKDVPMKSAGKDASAYDAIKEVLTLPVDRQMTCMGLMLDELDYQSRHAETAARAWAVGDIRTLKANLSDRPDLFSCVAAMSASLGAIRESGSAAMADAIEAALAQKGKTIVLLDMRELLRKGGLLERLEARHLTIEGPRD